MNIKRIITVFILVLTATQYNNLKAQNKEDAPCTVWSTLLFKEDFGGNNISDPTISPTGFTSGSTVIPYRTDFTTGSYTLTKAYPGTGRQYEAWDHTSLNDPTRGYLVRIDPDYTHAGAIIYSRDIHYLCSNAELTLSVWVSSLNKTSVTEHVSPKIELQIRDLSNNILSTSGLLDLGKWDTQADWRWQQKCLKVKTGNNISSLRFVVINRENDGSGNDWVMDDLEVRLISNSKIENTINNLNETNYKLNTNHETVDISSEYINEGILSSDLHSTWLYSETNDINSGLSDWIPIDYKFETVPTNTTINHPLQLINARKGYYIQSISNSKNGYKTNCRIDSKVIHLF